MDSLTVPQRMVDDIRRFCLSKAPHEAVGLLAAKGDREVLAGWVGLPNTSPTPRESYFVHPYARFTAEEALKQAGFEPIGAFHSHPQGSDEPSDFDRSTLHAVPVMVIVALRGTEAELTAWYAVDGEAREVPVNVTAELAV